LTCLSWKHATLDVAFVAQKHVRIPEIPSPHIHSFVATDTVPSEGGGRDLHDLRIAIFGGAAGRLRSLLHPREPGRKTVGPENEYKYPKKPLIFSDALAANIRLLGDQRECRFSVASEVAVSALHLQRFIA
jgi:hypothetical protein